MIDGYATHQQALVKAALETKGNILETGCGYYSTPILFEICKARGKKLVSMVQNLQWAKNFEHLIGEHYEQIVVNFEEELPIKGKYGMMFLDHEQFVRDRINHVNHMFKFTDVIVAHDSNLIPNYRFIEHPVKVEKFTKLQPHTVIIRK